MQLHLSSDPDHPCFDSRFCNLFLKYLKYADTAPFLFHKTQFSYIENCCDVSIGDDVILSITFYWTHCLLKNSFVILRVFTITSLIFIQLATLLK